MEEQEASHLDTDIVDLVEFPENIRNNLDDWFVHYKRTRLLSIDPNRRMTLRDLVQLHPNEVRKIPKIGERSLERIENILECFGLTLGMKLEEE